MEMGWGAPRTDDRDWNQCGQCTPLKPFSRKPAPGACARINLWRPPLLDLQGAGPRIGRPAWLHPGETTSSGGDGVLQPTGRGAKATGVKLADTPTPSLGAVTGPEALTAPPSPRR